MRVLSFSLCRKSRQKYPPYACISCRHNARPSFRIFSKNGIAGCTSEVPFNTYLAIPIFSMSSGSVPSALRIFIRFLLLLIEARNTAREVPQDADRRNPTFKRLMRDFSINQTSDENSNQQYQIPNFKNQFQKSHQLSPPLCSHVLPRIRSGLPIYSAAHAPGARLNLLLNQLYH